MMRVLWTILGIAVGLVCLPAKVATAVILTTASGIYDEQTVQLNQVNNTATTPTSGTVSLISLNDFKSSVSAAFLANQGGVIHFDDISTTTGETQIDVTYGVSLSELLVVTGSGYQMDMSANGTIQATTISGANYLRNQNPSHVYNFDTPLSLVGVTILGRNASRSVSATVRYDDLTTGTIGSISVGAGNANDTFFGFAAPAGRTINRLTLTSTNGIDFFVIDDLGFVIVPEPSSLIISLTGLGLIGATRRHRKFRNGSGKRRFAE